MDIHVNLTMPKQGALAQRLAVRAVTTALQRVFPGASLNVQSVDEPVPNALDEEPTIEAKVLSVRKYGGL